MHRDHHVGRSSARRDARAPRRSDRGSDRAGDHGPRLDARRLGNIPHIQGAAEKVAAVGPEDPEGSGKTGEPRLLHAKPPRARQHRAPVRVGVAGEQGSPAAVGGHDHEARVAVRIAGMPGPPMEPARPRLDAAFRAADHGRQDRAPDQGPPPDRDVESLRPLPAARQRAPVRLPVGPWAYGLAIERNFRPSLPPSLPGADPQRSVGREPAPAGRACLTRDRVGNRAAICPQHMPRERLAERSRRPGRVARIPAGNGQTHPGLPDVVPGGDLPEQRQRSRIPTRKAHRGERQLHGIVVSSHTGGAVQPSHRLVQSARSGGVAAPQPGLLGQLGPGAHRLWVAPGQSQLGGSLARLSCHGRA
jgi:hypothetical protein